MISSRKFCYLKSEILEHLEIEAILVSTDVYQR